MDESSPAHFPKLSPRERTFLSGGSSCLRTTYLLLPSPAISFSGDSLSSPSSSFQDFNRSGDNMILFRILSFGMDNIIYFVIGFKSFDIERISGTSCAWFRWTEWSRNAITRTTYNKTSMEWIVRVLEEATKTQGNTVCWWRKTDGITEVFWTWNYN